MDCRASPEAKIALFRSLFRGRDDVYPRRFESRKTGASGYQPACANEWARGLCEKPKVKCAACPHRHFLPVTDQVIRWHLSGQDDAGRSFVLGVYPMLRNESCFFLAADFDKAHWRDDMAAILATCRRMNLPAALERSRSGNGGHLWLFFDEAIPAGLARKLGAHLLTETMERRPDIGLDSYDRFFPNFEHKVFVRPTAFRPLKPPDADMRCQFHDLYAELIADEARNRLICEEVVRVVREGRSPVVLTERNEHLDCLAKRLSTDIADLIVLRGGMGRRQMRAVLAHLAATPDHGERLLLATGRYLGEGFDDARLDTLFLTLPVSWHGTIAQYVGRLHRLHDRKREVRVYDYADLNVPMLARMFDRRCRGYEAVGYTILLPASAVPGWPAEVPLPFDPEWKKDYAATVQRLVRDGVDTPLANLFVHVAQTVPSTAEGVHRARSATEAFLYRRLETLPETRGKFRLNAELPIAFDGTGHMEVDLLCAAARLAVELDGPQHLADTDAYRRDRRKDLLLQEHGYYVLRFLAEDVGQRLDVVLDAILRTLSRRGTTHRSSPPEVPAPARPPREQT